MSATSIGWTDLTLNPIVGCTHAGYADVSGSKKAHPGCDNCYAETMCSRQLPGFEPHNRCSVGGRWTGKIEVIPERLAWPFTRPEYRRRKDGKPRRCFLASLSDMGHPSLDEQDWLAINGMMVLAKDVVWQDLTKRPVAQAKLLTRNSPSDCVGVALARLERIDSDIVHGGVLNNVSRHDFTGLKWSDLPHIHRYVSVSDQSTADALIPLLLSIPAAVRGVSLEPMIGPVDLGLWLRPLCLDHVIVGGESGRKARPFALEWALDVIYRCRRAGVPCFVKQMGAKPYTSNVNLWDLEDRIVEDDPYWLPEDLASGCAVKFTGAGADPSEWPESLRVQQNVGDP